MYAFDVAVTQWINSLSGHSGILDWLVITVSTIGVPLMILAVATQWWMRRDRPHVRHVPIAAGLSFLLGLGLNQLIPLFLHRMRPYEANVTHLIISPTVDYSFPSDHATASFAIAAAFLLHGFSRRGAALPLPLRRSSLHSPASIWAHILSATSWAARRQPCLRPGWCGLFTLKTPGSTGV